MMWYDVMYVHVIHSGMDNATEEKVQTQKRKSDIWLMSTVYK